MKYEFTWDQQDMVVRDRAGAEFLVQKSVSVGPLDGETKRETGARIAREIKRLNLVPNGNGTQGKTVRDWFAKLQVELGDPNFEAWKAFMTPDKDCPDDEIWMDEDNLKIVAGKRKIRDKHLQRLLKSFNRAFVGVDFEGLPAFKIVVKKGLGSGGGRCSPARFERFKEAILPYTNGPSGKCGVSRSVMDVMLGAEKERKDAFFKLLVDTLPGTKAKYQAAAAMSDEWIEKIGNANHGPVGALIESIPIEERRKHAIVWDTKNHEIHEMAMRPFRDEQYLIVGEMYAHVVDASVKKDLYWAHKSNEIQGMGVAIHNNGKAYAIIGTHAYNTLRANFETWTEGAKLQDTADWDADASMVWDDIALWNRFPTTDDQGLVTGYVLRDDGRIDPPHPAGYLWNAPVKLHLDGDMINGVFKKRDKHDISVDMNMSEDSIIATWGQQIKASWSGVTVGVAANIASYGLNHEWPKAEIDLAKKVKCMRLDALQITYAEKTAYQEIKGKYIQAKKEDVSGHPIIEEFLSLYAAAVKNLEEDFIRGCGLPPVDLTGVETSLKAETWFVEYVKAFQDHKDVLKDGVEDPKEERMIFNHVLDKDFVDHMGPNHMQMAKELVKCVYDAGLQKIWTILGKAEDGTWARTVCMHLVRRLARFLLDQRVTGTTKGRPKLASGKVLMLKDGYGNVVMPDFKFYAEPVMIHAERKEPGKKGFYRVSVVIPSTQKQIAWFISKDKDILAWSGKTAKIVRGHTDVIAKF